MFNDTEDELNAERIAIKSIPYPQRSEEDKRRLNDVEAELRRRNTAPQAGGKDLLPQ